MGIFEPDGSDAEKHLQYYFRFAKIVSAISASFVNARANDIDKAIDDALKLSGQFFEAERAYIFQADAGYSDQITISNTHEWCKNNIVSIKHKYQNFPVSRLNFIQSFTNRSLSFIQFSNVNEMPAEMAEFQKILKEDGVVSILLLPLITNNVVTGCFGYDCMQISRAWSDEEVYLLQVIGEMFSSALLRKQTEHLHSLIEAHRYQSQKVDHLGRITASIAHHFNNQLQVIMGNLELLSFSDKYKINAMQSKSINDAIKATKKASELSTMLMSYLGEHNGQPHKERLMRQNENAEILPKNLEGAMILVVDDDEMVRFITVSLLEHFNFKVIEAKNGMHALELFEHFKSQIRLVVCDMIMPGMDGWQTIEALRTIAPGIPVILASGYDEAVASKDSHKEQPQVFLSKPFNSDSLQNAICKVLQAK